MKVHPFDDGNGRTARALTKYSLERRGWHLGGFVSPEEVFGNDTPSYYSLLAELGSRYLTQHADLSQWVYWFVRGLYVEATVAAVVGGGHSDALHDGLARMGIVGRLAHSAAEVWIRGTITRYEYATALGVSGGMASHDLALLEARRVVRREGQGRATRYVSLGPSVGGTVSHARQTAAEHLAALGL